MISWSFRKLSVSWVNLVSASNSKFLYNYSRLLCLSLLELWNKFYTMFGAYCLEFHMIFRMWYLLSAPGISASPSEDNMRYFNVMILGPTQSPYEGKVIIMYWWTGCAWSVIINSISFNHKLYLLRYEFYYSTCWCLLNFFVAF